MGGRAMAANTNLQNAKREKNDEFYARLRDVSEELRHYETHFRGKTILCNCNDPTWSAFWKYFHRNFERLGLKKLISTRYEKSNPTEKMEYEGGDDHNVKAGNITPLKGNGDFRSKECLGLLDECDIVVTNPPFSLFREYIKTLITHHKKFLIIGNMNAITYKEIFPLLKDNKIWLGYHFVKEFYQPDGSIKKFGNVLWYTNLDIIKRHERLILRKQYASKDYPKYDNYAAINVNKVADIPVNYGGVMGVPITFLTKHCPEQFTIIGATESEGRGCSCGLWEEDSGVSQPMVHGKRIYKRLFIQKRKNVL